MAFGARPLRGELILPSAVTHLVPPDYLSPEAKEYWSDMVRALGPAGLISEPDGPALAMLCENLADYWGLRQQLRDFPTDDSDKEMRIRLMNARVAATNALGGLDSRIRAWLNDMLLTPSARSRAQPVRAELEERPLDLSVLDADERAALREMLSKRGEQRTLN